MNTQEEFNKRQKGIIRERNNYAKKYPGTYKDRPIHELVKESGLRGKMAKLMHSDFLKLSKKK